MKAIINTDAKTIELQEEVTFDDLKKFIKEFKLEDYKIIPLWNYYYYPAFPYTSPTYSPMADPWTITNGITHGDFLGGPTALTYTDN